MQIMRMQKEFAKILKQKIQENYVQSNTLLLANIFENFRNRYLEIYDLDPKKLLSPSGLAWQEKKQ